MGAHVSAVPNHQMGRITPLSTRAAVAFFGVFGYELDPTVMPEEERAEVAQQVAFYKKHRELFQRGRFVRLRGPFDGDGNDTAWMVVAGDRATAVLGVYRVLNRDPFHGSPRSDVRLVIRVDRLRLRGLDPDASYRVTAWPTDAGSVVRGGDELMAAGLVLDAYHDDADRKRDFWARLFVLEADTTAGRGWSRPDG
jgi:alpha-galactosidase